MKRGVPLTEALFVWPDICENRRVKITATIITFNEEKHIAAAIESVDWADEILVVDSQSTDGTREIAVSKGARVIEREWPGFYEQKQFAVDEASHDWIISLDADERISHDLRSELLQIRRKGPKHAGYRMPRLSYYMGRPIRHSGWYPDRQLRLFDRNLGKWKKAIIHESVEMTGGTVGELTGDIIHYTVDSAASHHRMIGERYAPLGAQQMFDRGELTSPLKIAMAGPSTFIRSYLLKLGFLDGLPGFCISRFAAHHAFLKHLMLWEIQNMEQPASSRPSSDN